MNSFQPPQVRMIAILWRNGRPVIERDWYAGLRDGERERVNADLAERGFRWNGNTVEEI